MKSIAKDYSKAHPKYATCQKSNYREIILKDCYKMDIWPNHFFDNIIDIGANTGLFIMYAHMRHPRARIFAYEPCQESFDHLVANTFYMTNIRYSQEALGNGTEMGFCNTDRLQANQFHRREELDFDKVAYIVPSRPLSLMFKDNEVDLSSRYLVKIDCEGGERFLLEDEGCFEVIRNAHAFCLEVHFPPVRSEEFQLCPKWDFWNEWIKNFGDSHDITYHCSNKNTGTGVYVLVLRK